MNLNFVDMIYVQVQFFFSESKKVFLSCIFSFSDDMSSVKLPVDFVGQEVGMGFALKNTISPFSLDFKCSLPTLRKVF